jgi:hypothetical protein
MRPTMCIVFGTAKVLVNLPAGKACWAAEDAQRWLDDQFITHGWQPRRASGKVLTAEGLLAMASAVGQRDFEQREGLRLNFARAAEAALSRSVVRIDVDAHVVSFGSRAPVENRA